MAAVPNISTSPIHAELARALAQAVAGYLRTGMYFTASFRQLPNAPDNPYDIAGPYPVSNPSQAANLPDGYGIFGPFDNTLAGLGPAVDPQYSVTEVRITTSEPGGQPFTLPNANVTPLPDAVFFSVEAVSKFLVPYYTIVYSPVMAEQLLASFQNSDLALMVHLPWSESEDVGVSGSPDALVLIDHDGNGHTIGPRRGGS
jgi:hypothetical protein